MLHNGISLIYLAYNEAENLRALLPQAHQQLQQIGEDYEIIVVDTATPTDDTELVCKKNGAVYVSQEGKGFGGAYKTGIKHARYDKYLSSDSDGSINPAYITDIYKLFTSGEGYDIVAATRYTIGGRNEASPVNILMSKALNLVMRIVIGTSLHDLNLNFKMYKTQQLKEMESKMPLETPNFAVTLECLLKLKLLKQGKQKLGEIPIVFSNRVYGETKRRLFVFILEFFINIFKLLSLRFFGLKNFVLYGVFGLIAFGIDYVASLIANTALLPEISSMIGNALGFVFTFAMNTFFNFKTKDKVFIRFVSYFLIIVLGSAFSTLIIHILKDTMPFPALKISVLVIVSIIQFVLNKTITYRDADKRK